MKIRFLLVVLLTALFASTGWAALSVQTQVSIARQIKAAGADPVKLAAAAKAIMSSLPASQRVDAARAIMQSLTTDAANSTAAVNAVVSGAVGQTKTSAATAGGSVAVQAAAATAVASAMLGEAKSTVFTSARVSAISAGASAPVLPTAPASFNQGSGTVQALGFTNLRSGISGGTNTFSTSQTAGDASGNR